VCGEAGSAADEDLDEREVRRVRATATITTADTRPAKRIRRRAGTIGRSLMPLRASDQTMIGTATKAATAACAAAAPVMPPRWTPRRSAGTRKTNQTRLAWAGTFVLPTDVWMSKASVVTRRANMTAARSRHGSLDGNQREP